MADVFISYAREDVDFVRRLHQALANQDRESWVDWEGIPPRAEWLAEIKAAIDSGEAFVFVISPHSVGSQVCALELDHAAGQNKRIIPVVCSAVETESVDPRLAKLNWIFFRDCDDFDVSFQKVITALDTDLDWVHAHTRLLVRTVEWKEREEEKSFTLRGQDLKDAESWLTNATDKEPKPSSLQTQYILASRAAVTARQRVTFGAIAFGLIVATALSIMTYFQSVEKARQEKIANARHLINQAETLRDLSPNDSTPNPLEQSVKVAVQAMEDFNELGLRSVDADQTVRESMALLPRLVAELEIGKIGASAFDPTHQLLAVAGQRGKILVWDTIRRQEIATKVEELPANVPILGVAVSAGGHHLATVTYSKDVNTSTVTVWQLPQWTPRVRFQRSGKMEKLHLSPGGKYVYSLDTGTPWGWDVENGDALKPLADDEVIYHVEFSHDDRLMAMVTRKKGTRERTIRVLNASLGKEIKQWGQREAVNSLQWTSDSKNLLIISATKALLLEAETGRQISSSSLSGSGLLGPNQRFLAETAENYTVHVRLAPTGRLLWQFVEDSEVKHMGFGSDGHTLITQCVDKIHVWELGGGREFAHFSHDDPINHVGFSSGSGLFFTESAAHHRWWKISSRGNLLEPPKELINSEINLDPIPYQAQVIEDIIQSQKKNRVDILNANGTNISSLEFSTGILAAEVTHDGRRLAVTIGKPTRGGWECYLEIWDPVQRERLGKIPDPGFMEDAHVHFLAFTPDNQFLITKSREGFSFWDTKELTRTYIIYHNDPLDIAFQSKGTLAATVGRDQNVRIWDLTSKEEIARINETLPLKTLALSPDGRWLATLPEEGIARLWLVQPEDLITQAQSLLRLPPRPSISD
jgi:WD40 repeat protein